MNIWIISDTHFGHEKIFNFTDRPQNFTNRIVRSWKRNVRDDDLVIHLGDVTWKKGNYDIIKELPGRKVLVMGNHDYNSVKWYMENGFDFACNSFTLNYEGYDFIFTHRPLPKHCFDCNIHGHLHNAKPPEGNYYCISLENMGCRVFHFNEIFKEIKKVIK